MQGIRSVNYFECGVFGVLSIGNVSSGGMGYWECRVLGVWVQGMWDIGSVGIENVGYLERGYWECGVLGVWGIGEGVSSINAVLNILKLQKE